MKKVVFVLFRKAALTHEQCMVQWNGQQHTSLRRWVQNQVTEMPSDTAADGIGELWFDAKPPRLASEISSALV
jgi:hypothetical protein